MKRRGLLFVILCALLAVGLLLPVSGAAQPPEQTVFDRADLLTAQEEANLNSLAQQKCAQANCAFYVATHRVPVGVSSYSSKYIGEDFLEDHGLSENGEIVLLIITLDRGVYYYDLYLYGDAWDRVNSKERDYILDDDDVYDNIKGGQLEAGVSAYLNLSAQAYAGRLGVSYGIIIFVTLCISLLIAFLACFGVYQSYKAKKKSVDYPLDQFAKLKLTDHSDVFAGSFVTRRVIQSGSGGRGGGGSSHGGGGGHAGGR